MQPNKLRAKIAEAGMTQNQLSDAAGMAASTFSAKINGIRPFDADEIREICRILGLEDPAEMAQIFLL